MVLIRFGDQFVGLSCPLIPAKSVDANMLCAKLGVKVTPYVAANMLASS
jgi:hypothetical protein